MGILFGDYAGRLNQILELYMRLIDSGDTCALFLLVEICISLFFLSYLLSFVINVVVWHVSVGYVLSFFFFQTHVPDFI
jgi:hypothetical protein